jgi:hypothetical protein
MKMPSRTTIVLAIVLAMPRAKHRGYNHNVILTARIPF